MTFTYYRYWSSAGHSASSTPLRIMLETCLVNADVETVLLACSDGWPSHSNGQCASESATGPPVGLGHWLSESSSLLPLTKVRRVFHWTSRSSESRDHSLNAMTSMVDENKQFSDHPDCKRAMMLFWSEAKWQGIRSRPSAPFFCYEKRWSISENIPIVVGTIPLLAYIPVLSGKKSTTRRARLRFSDSDTNWWKKKGNFERKNVLFGIFRSKPVQQVSYRPGGSISSLSATAYV